MRALTALAQLAIRSFACCSASVMHLSSLNNGLVIKGLLALCYGVAECGRCKFDATSQVWCSDLMISE
ncbi:hypothetical protein BN874_2440012 [Candidatus Contendobacter odensis Run_B_J11]|uniref:Secreted protein n=1 Tax=Candidatus Contendobacter odensis Run_B_J11 TaxID=1400861 RepID=A0A7U7GBR2_9GAMM|nr:hypothetical protein BN874_2440012 [Candidatus Contendobacter odensis Run_B_J11]